MYEKEKHYGIDAPPATLTLMLEFIMVNKTIGNLVLISILQRSFQSNSDILRSNTSKFAIQKFN